MRIIKFNRKNPVLFLLLFTLSLIVLFFIALAFKSDARVPVGFMVNHLDHTHQEVIADRTDYEFTVITGGLLNAENTLEVYHDGVSVFDNTRSLKIENIGTTAVRNPRIIVNGKRDWWTIEDMLAEVITPEMSDRNKALAIWSFVRENRYHYLPAEEYGDELHDPVIFMNVYGYGFCDDVARILALLWHEAGLKSRVWVLSGHVVSEVWFEGQYHILDADTNAFYLLPDNHTIASVEQLSNDPLWIKRSHHFGRFYPDDNIVDKNTALLYGDDDFIIENPIMMRRSLQLLLRPGESFEWRWDNKGKYHDIMYHEGAPPYYANGKFVYTPDLHNEHFLDYFEDVEAVKVHTNYGHWCKKNGSISIEENKTDATFVIKIDSPYVIVGGRVIGEFVRMTENGLIRIYASENMETWDMMWSASHHGTSVKTIDMDKWMAPLSKGAFYTYYLKFELSSAEKKSAIGINYLSIETDVQMAPLSQPSLSTGINTIEYTDDTQKPHEVLLSFQWEEKFDTHPPAPPGGSIYPTSGSLVDSTRFNFKWQPAEDPDGDEISGYHFVLSDNPDFDIPLSPNFDLVVDDNQFDLPYEGLLDNGKQYYWKVRSRDEFGVWSDWSDVWSFMPSGPGTPLEVKYINQDVIVWQPNPNGTKPVSYEIYASTRRGFIPSKVEYQEAAWGDHENVLEDCSANFLALVSEPQYRIPSAGVTDEMSQTIYYRVIAVDQNGNRSAPTVAIENP